MILDLWLNSSARDAPDAVPVETRQEVGYHEGEVVEGEVGCQSQSADHKTLFFARLPEQPVRAGGVTQTIGRTAFGQFAHGFRADAVAPGHGAARFS